MKSLFYGKRCKRRSQRRIKIEGAGSQQIGIQESKMSTNYQDTKLLGEYEDKFTKGVLDTYYMLSELEDITSDEQFWKLFGRIEASYNECETAKNNYFEFLTKDGGGVKGCSLLYEFHEGMYCLDDKYNEIEGFIQSVKAIQ